MLSEGLATPPSLSRLWLVALLREACGTVSRRRERPTDGLEMKESDDGVVEEMMSAGSANEGKVPWQSSRASAVKVGGRRRRQR